MEIIKQSHKVVHVSCNNPNLLIEDSARICYKSHDKSQPGSEIKLVNSLVSSDHHAMLEFVDIVVDFQTNRAMTHELVRHRLSSFAQESQRWVEYDDQVKFIEPINYDESEPAWEIWRKHCEYTEQCYLEMLGYGLKAQQARTVLSNSVATYIRMKANLREWCHITNLRCAKDADPQMQALMKPVLAGFYMLMPEVFKGVATKHLTQEDLALAQIPCLDPDRFN